MSAVIFPKMQHFFTLSSLKKSKDARESVITVSATLDPRLRLFTFSTLLNTFQFIHTFSCVRVREFFPYYRSFFLSFFDCVIEHRSITQSNKITIASIPRVCKISSTLYQVSKNFLGRSISLSVLLYLE